MSLHINLQLNWRRKQYYARSFAALIFFMHVTPAVASNNSIELQTFRDRCEVTLKSKVHVHLKLEQTRFTHANSIAILQAKSTGATTAGHTPVGLTEADLSVRYKWAHHVMRDAVTGATCAAIDLHAYVSTQPQIVSVASEIPRDSCAFEFVYNHELKHVRVNDEHARRVAERIQLEMEHQFEGRVFHSMKDDLTTTLRDAVESKWSSFGRQLLSEASIHHGHIDSAAEYEAVNNVCDQQIPKILTRYRLSYNSAQIQKLRANSAQ